MAWTQPHSEFYKAHQQLETALKGDERPSLLSDDSGSKPLVSQNIELRQKLEEQHGSYKRKLQAYQDGQQRQAQLVQKLQAKVLQYKRRCGELEEHADSQRKESDYNKRSLRESHDTMRTRLESTEAKLRYSETDHSMDLETALIKLEEEQQRSASLAHVNTMLREQLDQATAANQSLTVDIHKLTQDWQRAREELEVKEAEWRGEEQSFNEYFSAEHSRLLQLWRGVVAFRRQFSEMKNSCERDLSHMRSDYTRATRSVHSACLNLSANVRNVDTQSQLEISRREHEFVEQQGQFESQISELNSRINELSILNEKLKVQVSEKDKTVCTLQRTVATLEARVGDSPRDYIDARASMDPAVVAENEEIAAMHEALRRIAQEVICDADRSMEDDAGDPNLSTSVLRPSSPLRAPSRGRRSASSSPVRHRSPGRSLSPSRAPSFADSTYAAVQAALNKRQLQVTELRAKLSATKDHNSSLKKQCDDIANEYRRMEQQLLTVKEERDNSMRGQQDSERNQDRLRSNLDLAGSERAQLDRVRQALSEQVECMNVENQKLQAANAALQQERDQLEDQREDVIKDKERQIKENDRCRKVLDQNENKLSKLREDLVTTKECLNRAMLDKEVLMQEKAELGDALSKAEICKAELEQDVNKTKSEEASLRDALLKMQALNEGLGQDKIELNKILMQMEAEKAELYGQKQAVEQEKTGIREELVRVEQEKMDVENEKSGVIQSLQMTEDGRAKLEQEIMMINREKGEVIEQLGVVSRQKNALAEELISSRKEIERQSDTIVRISKEKEELTREKGTLAVQLTASERECREESEVIAALKES